MKKWLIFLIIAVSAVFLFGYSALAYDVHTPEVKGYNYKTQHLDLDFLAFDKDFKGGVNLAIAKLYKNKKSRFIIAGAGPGGGPQVKIFNKKGKLQKSFLPFSEGFRGGVDVAAGDVNGDGKDELIFSQLSHGQAWIKVYSSNTKSVLSNFLAFDKSFKGGAHVASGDVNNDGRDEIIVGAGAGGGPQVRVFTKLGNPIFSTFPFARDFDGGVDVASGDVNGDNKDEVIASQASQGQAWVKVFKANSQKTILGNFLAYSKEHEGGASVAATQSKKNKKARIITGAGQGGGPSVRAFDYNGRSLNKDFFAFDKNYKGGINVAAGKLKSGQRNKILVSTLGFTGEQAKYPYNKYIEVNISEQKLKYFENGYKKGESLASTGTYATPTPLGTFRVFNKRVSVLMAGPGYYLPGVPYVLSFLGPYTIHGTYWHSNYGHRMSHGCVNLPTPFAKELYYWADVGTPVIIHN